MENKERVLRALKVTRAMRLPDREVLDVLKPLWKMFDYNWDAIEADDYRALLDTYFENKESKGVEPVKKNVSEDDGNERPLKRTYLHGQKNHASSAEANQSQILTERDGDRLSVATPGLRIRDSSPPSSRNKLHPTSESNSLPSFALGSSNCKHCENSSIIASSELGEVKLSLNYNTPAGLSSFRISKYLEVLKYLEDKYIKICKIVTPDFSVKTLLEDLCNCYAKMGNVSTKVAIKVAKPLHPSGVGAQNVASENKVPEPFGQRKAACGQKKSFTQLSDIAKGSENVKIPLVGGFGNEKLPKFTYMPRNIVYQKAYVQISLARISDEDCCSDCSGDCLSYPIPCACARETGGEFAYTRGGLLKEEFLADCIERKNSPQKHHFVHCQDCPLERSKNDECKGHLIKKFIKECWTKCGCNMECGNRVIQRGIKSEMQVFSTCEGKGWGVKTLQELPKGTFVCEYVGEIVTNTELYERNIENSGCDRHTYPVTLDADWGSERILKDEEALCLDATFSGNVARFINHRCSDANLIDIPVEVETPDRHYYHLAFFTTRQVNALEELTWDYGIDFDDHDHPIKAFKCSCGSTLCRDVKQKGPSQSQS